MKKLAKYVIAPLLTAGLAVVPASGAAKKGKTAATTAEATSPSTDTNNSKKGNSSNPGQKKGHKKGNGAKKKK
jgi:hypothetical protein